MKRFLTLIVRGLCLLPLMASALGGAPRTLAASGVARPVAQQASTVYLPVIQAPWGRITGSATSSRGGTTGHTVQLRSYQPAGANPSTLVASTTVAADGTYVFAQVPALPTDYAYYVFYTPTIVDPAFLIGAYSPDVTALAAGQVVGLGTLNVTGLDLASPADQIVASMPTSFTWIRRPTTTDIYYWRVFDPGGVLETLSTDDLGYVDQVTISQFPAAAGYQASTLYGWNIGIVMPDNSLGFSRSRRITFSNINTYDLVAGLGLHGQLPIGPGPDRPDRTR